MVRYFQEVEEYTVLHRESESRKVEDSKPNSIRSVRENATGWKDGYQRVYGFVKIFVFSQREARECVYIDSSSHLSMHLDNYSSLFSISIHQYPAYTHTHTHTHSLSLYIYIYQFAPSAFQHFLSLSMHL